jgi:hypothetical protein
VLVAFVLVAFVLLLSLWLIYRVALVSNQILVLTMSQRYQYLIVVASFIKPQKKVKEAVPDSKQSDHCAT